MSREDVEMIRAIQPEPDVDLVEFFGRGDAATAFQALEPLFGDGFEVVGHGPQIVGPLSGPDGLREAWLEWLGPWDSYRTEIEDVVDLDDRVLVLTRDFGTERGIEGEVRQLAAAIWSVEAGKLVRAEFYADRRQALAAAGLDRD